MSASAADPEPGPEGSVGRNNQDAFVEVFGTVWSSLGRLAPILFVLGLAWFFYTEGQSKHQDQLDKTSSRLLEQLDALAGSMDSQVTLIKNVTALSEDVAKLTASQVASQVAFQAELDKLSERQSAVAAAESELGALRKDVGALAEHVLTDGYREDAILRLALRYRQGDVGALREALRQLGESAESWAAEQLLNTVEVGVALGELEQALSEGPLGFAYWLVTADRDTVVGVHEVTATGHAWVVKIRFDDGGYAQRSSFEILEEVQAVRMPGTQDFGRGDVFAAVRSYWSNEGWSSVINIGATVSHGVLLNPEVEPWRVLSGELPVAEAPAAVSGAAFQQGLGGQQGRLYWDSHLHLLGLSAEAKRDLLLGWTGVPASWQATMDALGERLARLPVTGTASDEGRLLSRMLADNRQSAQVKASTEEELTLVVRDDQDYVSTFRVRRAGETAQVEFVSQEYDY